MILTTSFIVRHDDGPTVTATREQGSWRFSWKGGGGSVLGLGYKQAEAAAVRIAEMLKQIEDEQLDVIAYLEGLAEPPDGATQ